MNPAVSLKRTVMVAMLCVCCAMRWSVAAEPANSHVTEGTKSLLHDDFEGLTPGQFSRVVGAHTEYHYLRGSSGEGNWSVTSFRSGIGSQRAWKVFRVDDDAALAQTFDNRKTKHSHPMVIAGEDVWGDYTVTVRFAPQSDRAQSGVVFRYRNDRCYYWCYK